MNHNKKLKLILVVSEDLFFLSHRLSLALAAIENGFDVTLITKVTSHAEKIKKRGIKIIDLNFVRSSKSPLNDVINIIKLIYTYRREKPDIIHNFSLKIILISSVAACFSKNAVIVNAFTGLGYIFSANKLKARFIRFFVKPIFRLVMKRYDCWTIFQNPDDMSLFKELRLISDKRSVLVRGSGVDTNEFLQTQDKNTVPVVMLASRMLWDKGINEFVEAARDIRSHNVKAKFILLGDVDTENPMSIPVAKLDKWTDEGCVIWMGYSQNMPESLSSSSIVCLPSYREGLPKVLLEAAAIGRPLIAADVPGCREIVKDGENGILVKVKDKSSLSNAILKLISNKKLRGKMGQKSRHLVETEFSAEIINSQIIRLYNKALKYYLA